MIGNRILNCRNCGNRHCCRPVITLMLVLGQYFTVLDAIAQSHVRHVRRCQSQTHVRLAERSYHHNGRFCDGPFWARDSRPRGVAETGRYNNTGRAMPHLLIILFALRAFVDCNGRAMPHSLPLQSACQSPSCPAWQRIAPVP
jgi:hypothetical protein